VANIDTTPETERKREKGKEERNMKIKAQKKIQCSKTDR